MVIHIAVFFFWFCLFIELNTEYLEFYYAVHPIYNRAATQQKALIGKTQLAAAVIDTRKESVRMGSLARIETRIEMQLFRTHR